MSWNSTQEFHVLKMVPPILFKQNKKTNNAVQMGLKRVYLFLVYIYDSLPTCM